MGNVYPAEFKAQVVELHRRQGRSLAELGRAFHLSATTVANWVREANATDAKDPTLTSEDKAELVLLRRQLKAREEELEILGKRWPSSRADKTGSGLWAHQRREGHPSPPQRGPPVPGAGRVPLRLLRLAGRLAGPPGRRVADDLAVLDQIRQVHARFAGYGSPRVHRELQARQVRVGRHRVARLMRQHAIGARWGSTKRPRSVPPQRRPAVTDRVRRHLRTPAPDRLWCTDTTMIRTQQGWLRAAVILDAYSRKVISWSVDDREDPQPRCGPCGRPSRSDDPHPDGCCTLTAATSAPPGSGWRPPPAPGCCHPSTNAKAPWTTP